eukprot:12177112-Alexandrium_andersonii.AAC.1
MELPPPQEFANAIIETSGPGRDGGDPLASPAGNSSGLAAPGAAMIQRDGGAQPAASPSRG